MLNAVIQPGSASVTEGSSGTKVVNVPVTLSTTSTATVTAKWSTGNNGATAPADHVTASGTVTFAPGQTSRTVAVTIRGDILDEADEGLVVGFNTPTNAVVGGFYGLAPVTIVDDD